MGILDEQEGMQGLEGRPGPAKSSPVVLPYTSCWSVGRQWERGATVVCAFPWASLPCRVDTILLPSFSKQRGSTSRGKVGRALTLIVPPWQLCPSLREQRRAACRVSSAKQQHSSVQSTPELEEKSSVSQQQHSSSSLFGSSSSVPVGQ